MARAPHLAQGGRRALARLVLGQPNAGGLGGQLSAAPTSTTSPTSFRPEPRPSWWPRSTTSCPAGRGCSAALTGLAASTGMSNWKRPPTRGLITRGFAGISTGGRPRSMRPWPDGAPAALKKPVLRVTLKTSDGQDAGTKPRPWSLIRGSNTVRSSPAASARDALQPWSPDSPALTAPNWSCATGTGPVTAGWSGSGCASSRCAATVSSSTTSLSSCAGSATTSFIR